MAQFCSECGAPRVDENVHCTSCGAEILIAKPKRKRRDLTVDELVHQGLSRYGSGRTSAARESFTKAVELDPTSAEAWFGLGITNPNDHIKQQECFARVLEINPEHEKARQWLGNVERILQNKNAFFAPQPNPQPPQPHPQAIVPTNTKGNWTIHISSQLITIPKQCVCCGGQPDTQKTFTATQTRGKQVSTRIKNAQTKGWDFPFCYHCIEHDRQASQLMVGPRWGYAGSVILLLGAVFTIQIWLIALILACAAIVGLFFASKRMNTAKAHARELLHPTCVDTSNKIVQYLGWYKSTHSFSIQAQTYAINFMRANRARLVNMPIEVLRVIDGQ